MQDRSLVQLAPSPLQSVFAVNCDNPFLSANEVNNLCTSAGLGPTDDVFLEIDRRNVEGGFRRE